MIYFALISHSVHLCIIHDYDSTCSDSPHNPQFILFHVFKCNFLSILYIYIYFITNFPNNHCIQHELQYENLPAWATLTMLLSCFIDSTDLEVVALLHYV